jgi:hypothetical protein
MRVRGFEPPRAFAQCALNASRLPFRHTRVRCSKSSAASGFAPDVLDHQRDAGSTVDSHIPAISRFAANAVIVDSDEIAGGGEKINDVLGSVAEVVAQVLVGLRPVDIRPVDEGAAIGTDASTKERPGGRLEQLRLPLLELDLALVLSPNLQGNV